MKHLKISLILSLLSVTFFSFSQLISVKDDAFRTYLCNSINRVMNDDCTMLDTNIAQTDETISRLSLTGLGVSDISEVIYFTQLDSIIANKNVNLKTIPNIYNLEKLRSLNMSNTSVEIAPDLIFINPLDSTQNVAPFSIHLRFCAIHTLPNSWYLKNEVTEYIHMQGNQLTSVPDFLNVTNIRTLNIFDNNLSFKELIPITYHPRYEIANFDMFPQNNFEVDFPEVAFTNETININISRELPSNTYFMFKGNELLEQNNTGEFTVSVSSLEDEGSYHFEIRNSNFTGEDEFLSSGNYELKVMNESLKKKDLLIFSPDGDGELDFLTIDGEGEAIFYTSDGQEILSESLPFDWTGNDEKGELANSGIYVIEKSNGEFIKVLLLR